MGKQFPCPHIYMPYRLKARLGVDSAQKKSVYGGTFKKCSVLFKFRE